MAKPQRGRSWNFFFLKKSSNPVSGSTVNPYNPAYTSGGSSGGEAALIGSHLDIGSDVGFLVPLLIVAFAHSNLLEEGSRVIMVTKMKSLTQFIPQRNGLSVYARQGVHMSIITRRGS